jgi:hypothetical protein
MTIRQLFRAFPTDDDCHIPDRKTDIVQLLTKVNSAFLPPAIS